MDNKVIDDLFNNEKNIFINGEENKDKLHNIIIPFIDKSIEKRESFIVLDTKDEYISKYARKLKTLNYNVIILNLKDMDLSVNWNPLEYPYELYSNGNKDIAIELIENMANEIFLEDEEKYFYTASKDLFIGLVLSMFETNTKEEININNLANILLSSNAKPYIPDYLTNYFSKLDPNSIAFLSAAPTVLAPKETRANIISTCLQKLRVFSSREKLKYLLSKNSFDYESITKGLTAVFILTKNDEVNINQIGYLFLKQLINVITVFSDRKYNVFLSNLDNTPDGRELISFVLKENISKIKYFTSVKSLNQDEINKASEYSYIININNGEIKVTVDNEEKIGSVDETHIIYINDDSVYPKLEINDLPNFGVKTNNSDYFESLVKANNYLNSEPENIDDLIKEIDKKLAELDKLEESEDVKDEVDFSSLLKVNNIEERKEGNSTMMPLPKLKEQVLEEADELSKRASDKINEFLNKENVSTKSELEKFKI